MLSVVGHKNIRKQLATMISCGVVPHALLFSGQQGIGKRMVAQSFLKALFCLGSKRPCGTCPSCMQMDGMSHPDFVMLTPNEKGVITIGEADDADSNSVRGLIHRLSMRSVTGRFGIIIDGMDRASNEAQNALLKMLEEPPEGSCIVALSSDRSKILPTIHSRTQEFRFAPLGTDSIRSIISVKEQSEDVVDFVTAVSGGSASVAFLLCDDEIREKFLSYCRTLSNSIARGVLFNQMNSPLPILPKGGIDAIDILINVYWVLSEYKIREEGLYSSLFDDIYIDDINALRTIIKLLFVAKKGRTHNINVALHIRALAYHAIHRSAFSTPPFVRECY